MSGWLLLTLHILLIFFSELTVPAQDFSQSFNPHSYKTSHFFVGTPCVNSSPSSRLFCLYPQARISPSLLLQDSPSFPQFRGQVTLPVCLIWSSEDHPPRCSCGSAKHSAFYLCWHRSCYYHPSALEPQLQIHRFNTRTKCRINQFDLRACGATTLHPVTFAIWVESFIFKALTAFWN